MLFFLHRVCYRAVCLINSKLRHAERRCAFCCHTGITGLSFLMTLCSCTLLRGPIPQPSIGQNSETVLVLSANAICVTRILCYQNTIASISANSCRSLNLPANDIAFHPIVVATEEQSFSSGDPVIMMRTPGPYGKSLLTSSAKISGGQTLY
jgi:hypothetical protein